MKTFVILLSMGVLLAAAVAGAIDENPASLSTVVFTVG